MGIRVEGILVEEKHFEPGQSISWHRHEGSYGCLMLGGLAEEERRGGEISLALGDCSWRPPQARHRFLTGGAGAHALTFEIPEARLGDLADGGLSSSDFKERHSGTALALGFHLWAEMQHGGAADRLGLEALVLDLILEATATSPDPGDPGEPAWLYRVRDRLHDEVGARFGLSELAAEAGVHPVHLARTFRRRFGCPLGAYHRRLRLDRGLREVIETDTSLAEIALASGFTDQSHFTKLVTSTVGLSPGRLRQLRRIAPSWPGPKRAAWPLGDASSR
ncbi:MAG: AraC family transcriptional regulator [Holophagales bacterium]|nr:AraC family transcriptional regulator [Holophagales bacterium]